MLFYNKNILNSMKNYLHLLGQILTLALSKSQSLIFFFALASSLAKLKQSLFSNFLAWLSI